MEENYYNENEAVEFVNDTSIERIEHAVECCDKKPHIGAMLCVGICASAFFGAVYYISELLKERCQYGE